MEAAGAKIVPICRVGGTSFVGMSLAVRSPRQTVFVPGQDGVGLAPERTSLGSWHYLTVAGVMVGFSQVLYHVSETRGPHASVPV